MLQKHKYIKFDTISYKKRKTLKATKGGNEKGEKLSIGMPYARKKRKTLVFIIVKSN